MANNEGETEQKPGKVEQTPEGGDRMSLKYGGSVSSVGSSEENANCEVADLMAAIVERGNMWQALRRVERNHGAAGVDGKTVEQLRPWLKENWDMIREKLLGGSYRPQAVRRVDIPKSGGGRRSLGIPTVLDRLIQQAIAQVLGPIFDPDFSETSYGFRPNRSARDAVKQSRAYQQEGKRWAVDLDLEKFFDNVNHDILMQCLRQRVKDPILMKLIGRYLRAGMMADGIESPRSKGTPQGGPLSPLLSNILLDRFDKELESRGHAYVRYADDCTIYVKSRRSGERVLESVSRWLAKHLRLKVNEAKSAVDRPWKRTLLGYSVTNHHKTKLRVSPESVKRLRQKVRAKMREGRGRNVERFIKEDLNPLLRGWVNYFCEAETRGVFDELDQWVRRRLRTIYWRQWKRPKTRRRKLMKLGLDEVTASKNAYNGRGAWWNSGASHMNRALRKKYFDGLGLVNLQSEIRYLERTLSL